MKNNILFFNWFVFLKISFFKLFYLLFFHQRPPFIVIREAVDKDVKKATGYCIEMLDAITAKYNNT